MLKQIDHMKNKERIQILETEISRLKVANRNNIYRIEAIESHLAEQHKGANFSKLNIPDSISQTPDYTHLLPDGYEFCSEADAEKWVKVEMIYLESENEYKTYYRPIRPIQYKVTTHEIVTAVPDPYMPDWSQAPEGTVAHAWDANGMGYWYLIGQGVGKFWHQHKPSPFTPPADLDWKQSLRVKPN
jgi:hypothetical protein